MQLYRFSPIKNEKELMEAIEFLHFACFALCRQSLGMYLPTSGNIGIFCHYDDEYESLIKIQKKLIEPADNSSKKYLKLQKPIVISAKDDVPQTVYTHLYIRKPDPYRAHIGDIDFILEADKYASMKHALLTGEKIKGARVYYRLEPDMIELYDPDVDALGYVCTQRIIG